MSGYDRFLTLADELRSVIQSMRKKIDRRLPNLSNGEEKKRVLREMDGELDDSQRLLREMQTEAESDLQVPLSYRQQLNAQMKDFRSQVDQIRVQTSKIKSDDLSRRDGGYNGNSSFNSDLDVQQTANRSRLLQGRVALERTSDSLHRSLAVASETEQIGTEVIGELHTQRESLENTRNRLEDTNVELGKSRKIIQSMGRKEGSGVAGGLNNVKQTSGPSACGDLFSGLSMYSRVQQIRLTSVLAALQMFLTRQLPFFSHAFFIFFSHDSIQPLKFVHRIVTNKLFLIVIIVLECAVLVGVVYWKFIKK